MVFGWRKRKIERAVKKIKKTLDNMAEKYEEEGSEIFAAGFVKIDDSYYPFGIVDYFAPILAVGVPFGTDENTKKEIAAKVEEALKESYVKAAEAVKGAGEVINVKDDLNEVAGYILHIALMHWSLPDPPRQTTPKPWEY